MADAKLEHDWMAASFIVAHIRNAWLGEKVAPADLTPYAKPRAKVEPPKADMAEFRAFAKKMGVRNA